MKRLAITTMLALATALPACERPDTGSPGGETPAANGESASAESTFVDRVWIVAESEQVEIGSYRVFLSEGTLVMASPHATPAFGSWRYVDGRLTIVEEGIEYAVDIVELTRDTFRIRIHSPGDPVEIRFGAADIATCPA